MKFVRLDQSSIGIIFILPFILLDTESKHVPKDKEECNLLVDIIFMLDGHSSISDVNFVKQKSFVKYIIEHHNAPPGTVQVGFVVCSDDTSYETEFQSSDPDVSRYLKELQKPLAGSPNNKTIHCIDSVENLLNGSKLTREHSTKIAMLLIGDNRPWTSEDVLQKTTDMKDSGVNFIVISIGNKSFDQLNALETIATTNKFLVLKSYRELIPLSEHFSKKTCLPLSLDLDPNQIARQQTTTTTTSTMATTQSTCMAIESSVDFDFKIKLPFFGWINKKCLPGTKFDLPRCECIVDSIVRIANATQSPVT